MTTRGGSAALRLAAMGAVLWAAAGPCPAARKAVVESAASAPAWAREAAAAPTGFDTSGLDSVELLDEWIVRPLEAGGVRTTHRRVARVLRPEGLEDVASLAVSFGKDDRVESAQAWNMLPDGTMRRPDAKDDVSELPYTAGGNDVDDARVRVVSLPGVIVGSVAAFESVTFDAVDRGARIVTFGDASEPVGPCRLTLEAPAGWAFSDHALRAKAFTRAATASGLTWQAPAVPRPPVEDWAPEDEELLPRIAVSWRSPDGTRGFADWNAVAAWYRKLADPVLSDVGEAAAVSARLKPAAAGAGVLEGSLRDAFAFASRDIRYVSIQMGIGGYKPQAPAFTCANRYGDCKAKTFLFRTVVEPWGWKAHPVFVATRDAGPVIPEVPTPGQFNHLIVGLVVPEGIDAAAAWNVRTIEGVGRVAFLDPTTTDLGPWQLRDDDQGTTALLVLPDRGVLVDLPVQPPEAARVEVELEASLDESGRVASGMLRSRSSGTRAGDSRSWHAQLSKEQLASAMERWLQGWVPGAKLAEHSVEGVASLDGDIVETARFSGGSLGQRAGDMLILRPPALALPFNAARLAPPPREHRLDLGLPVEKHVRIAITPPPGWSAEALPKPVDRSAPQFTLSCAWERTETILVLRATGRQVVSAVAPSDYAAFRDAARAAAGAESEGIVLVRSLPAGN